MIPFNVLFFQFVILMRPKIFSYIIIFFLYWRILFGLHMYGKDLLTCIRIHIPGESICQFHSFTTSWVAMDSGRQYCKDIIQIEIQNNVNERAGKDSLWIRISNIITSMAKRVKFVYNNIVT